MKVVLADLALSQLTNRPVSSLSRPEYRRLCIGVQLVRDPSTYDVNDAHARIFEHFTDPNAFT